MKTVVAFSAGTDSVAALIDSINKYGKENIIAYILVLATDKGQVYLWQEAQLFYAKKICEELGVELVVNTKNMVSGGHNVSPDIYEWCHALIIYCIGNKDIARAVDGFTSDDVYHKHALLWWDIFDRCMKANDKSIKLEHPLTNISKQDCYSMISENIREYIWTCIKPKGTIRGKQGIKKYVACDECGKCKEFQSKVLLKDNYV